MSAAALATAVEMHSGPRSDGSYDPLGSSTPTSEQYVAFESVFDHFNVELFGGALPPAMLTFAKRSRSYGFYRHDRWRRSATDEGHVGEIALSPDHLTRGEKDVASTIVHEMVHLWQFSHGSPSRRGYHNAEWGTRMEAVGLMPSNTGEPGGKRTGQRMTHYIIDGGPFDIAFGRLDRAELLPFIAGSPPLKDKPGPRKSDPSKTKYTCAACGLNAWAKRDADLVHCLVVMVVAS